ncbi:MAG: ERV/ALR sulfhydryl oxidase domain-containing protein [Linnemannia gamsii]|nr:MAG: ERV/ALR sulfhydryl oxidase domain-containing protein [Linnemannia gamsii]
MSSAIPRRIRLKSPLAIIALCFIGLVTIPSLMFLTPKTSFSLQDQQRQLTRTGSPIGGAGEQADIFVDPSLSEGGTIMPQLGNATAKAELGRATWKLLHTMAARYPLQPKPDERAAIKQWIYLLSRLYPCGECATHFQAMLKQHPPQTSSRASLSNWACSVHNIVNVRLGKPEFDCSTLSDVYKCGCVDEPTGEEGEEKGQGMAGDGGDSSLADEPNSLASLAQIQLDRETIVDDLESEQLA